MLNRAALSSLFFLILLHSSLPGQGTTAVPPAPDQYVTDKAGFLSQSERDNLEWKLAEFERSSGCQFIIYIDASSGGTPIEDWAARAFSDWGIGKKGADNGIALFIFSDDRRMRIEVGYGLEGQVPDALAARIISDIIAPRLRENDRDGAVAGGADALMAVITGKAAEGGREERRPAESVKKVPLLQKVLIGLALFGFLILLITHPSLALYLLFSILSGGRGGSGGGGGFRGGGGRSGGGGASGSW